MPDFRPTSAYRVGATIPAKSCFWNQKTGRKTYDISRTHSIRACPKLGANFASGMYPQNPILINVTTQASKQENKPEWKAETTLINICSIKSTLEV